LIRAQILHILDKLMQNNYFKNWLDKLIDTWVSREPEVIIDICADKFEWYEYPFQKVITTKEDLLKEWQSVLSQKNIYVTYEIITVQDNIGLAHWSGSFTRDTGKKVQMDGIWKFTLNNEGKCTEFRQWYMVKD